LLVVPYLVEALLTDTFRWGLCLGFLAVGTGVSLLLEFEQDWPVLAGLAVAVESHVFDAAWPVTGFAKLLFVDVALFGYLVVRPLPRIGFDFRARWSDVLIGLREFAYYTPVALALGFTLGFLHLHRAAGSAAAFSAAWIFTIFFIAMPEELFFRGLLLNLLERRLGTRAAFWITSVAFGLAHFNKRTTGVNWRYVILAAIAGCFYARAWLAQRRLLASSITHATVDTVWSLWLR
jgi:membrane protease YdiL (CAAX protease family)